MTDRANGRHRASHRASTPLSSIGSSLTTAVSDHVSTFGRSGVVIAMSSGLVASLGGLPAQAVPGSTTAHTASMPVTARQGNPFSGAPASLINGEAITAPSTAALSFDSGAFTPVAPPPAPKPVVTQTATTSRQSTSTPAGRSGTAQVSRSTTRTAVKGGAFGSAKGESVLAVAARYVGVPYVYGGSSPRGMDCSGYVQYVFAQLGISLPRTADQQMHATTRISRSEAGPGDLVFFVSGGSAYHVGIYAGNNMMYDAGRPGETIVKRAIWTATVVFGRVG